MRRLLTPRFLGWHALALLAAAVCALMGRWQLDVSLSHRGSLRNSIYAYQWWAFGLFVVYAWVRLMRDEVRPGQRPAADVTQPRRAPVAERLSPFPARRSAPVDPVVDEREEAELQAYNRYLAELNSAQR